MMSIPSNVNIAKVTQEKVLIYSGIEFIGRVEHYQVPGIYKIVYFAESPCQKDIAICNNMEECVKFLISVSQKDL
jgi:hypothetical protein